MEAQVHAKVGRFSDLVFLPKVRITLYGDFDTADYDLLKTLLIGVDQRFPWYSPYRAFACDPIRIEDVEVGRMLHASSSEFRPEFTFTHHFGDVLKSGHFDAYMRYLNRLVAEFASFWKNSRATTELVLETFLSEVWTGSRNEETAGRKLEAALNDALRDDHR